LKACKKADVKLGLSIVDISLANFEKLAKRVEEAGADFVDVPLGCPNAERLGEGGASIGADVKATEEVVKAVRKAVSIPVFVKIPQIPTYAEPAPPKVALACERAGANAVVCYEPAINGIAVDVEEETFFGLPTPIAYIPGRPFKPYTLSLIAETVPKMKIPVIGVNGVTLWSDVIEYLMMGCHATYSAMAGMVKGISTYQTVIEGIKSFMLRKGYTSIQDFRGKVIKKLKSLSDLPQLEGKTWVMPSPIFPSIDIDRCNLCGRCTICPNAALLIRKEKDDLWVDREHCSGCGLCITTCSQDAIKLVDEKGKVYWNGVGTTKLWSK
jgi:dihydropyrimidine dehydrogenase (NAD+) subunit PreA